ncbi:MAG TPA: 2-amino-4-hydroxy-6-hydroxymethyldihydropteridine diphosphokinase [Segetibacter sp.]|jgi:2-amino-4-hydroxy-6-hydroxymethyldihydropteridine diphosphokinase
MDRAFLLIGGNLGDRLLNLKEALVEIRKSVGKIVGQSQVYETAAWGITEQPAFLNQVLLVETHLPATQLLSTLLKIEKKLGRKRKAKLGPRIIDIDILFFNDDIISSPDLVIPHPELPNRRFALVPLNEVAPHFKHPVLQKTVAEMLKVCPDNLKVEMFSC